MVKYNYFMYFNEVVINVNFITNSKFTHYNLISISFNNFSKVDFTYDFNRYFYLNSHTVFHEYFLTNNHFKINLNFCLHYHYNYLTFIFREE